MQSQLSDVALIETRGRAALDVLLDMLPNLPRLKRPIAFSMNSIRSPKKQRGGCFTWP